MFVRTFQLERVQFDGDCGAGAEQVADKSVARSQLLAPVTTARPALAASAFRLLDIRGCLRLVTDLVS